MKKQRQSNQVSREQASHEMYESAASQLSEAGIDLTAAANTLRSAGVLAAIYLLIAAFGAIQRAHLYNILIRCRWSIPGEQHVTEHSVGQQIRDLLKEAVITEMPEAPEERLQRRGPPANWLFPRDRGLPSLERGQEIRGLVDAAAAVLWTLTANTDGMQQALPHPDHLDVSDQAGSKVLSTANNPDDVDEWSLETTAWLMPYEAMEVTAAHDAAYDTSLSAPQSTISIVPPRVETQWGEVPRLRPRWSWTDTSPHTPWDADHLIYNHMHWRKWRKRYQEAWVGCQITAVVGVLVILLCRHATPDQLSIVKVLLSVMAATMLILWIDATRHVIRYGRMCGCLWTDGE